MSWVCIWTWPSAAPLDFLKPLKVPSHVHIIAIDEIVGDSRWVVIKTEHDHYSKIHMVKKDGYFSLHHGWELLVASENLEEQQMVMFRCKPRTVSIYGIMTHRDITLQSVSVQVQLSVQCFLDWHCLVYGNLFVITIVFVTTYVNVLK